MRLWVCGVLVVLVSALGAAAQDNPSDSTSLTLFGITFSQADEASRQRYQLSESDRVIVRDPGKDFKRLGISHLEPGYVVTIVSDVQQKRVRNVLFATDVAEAILESLTKSDSGQDTYVCRIVFRRPNPPDPKSRYVEERLTMTEADLQELRHIFRPVTIFGITFSHGTRELQAQYHLGMVDRVIVTDPGTGPGRIGLGALKAGTSVTSVSAPGLARGVRHPVDLAKGILESLRQPQPGQDLYTCNLMLRSFNAQAGRVENRLRSLTLTAKDVEQLKAAIQPPKKP